MLCSVPLLYHFHSSSSSYRSDLQPFHDSTPDASFGSAAVGCKGTNFFSYLPHLSPKITLISFAITFIYCSYLFVIKTFVYYFYFHSPIHPTFMVYSWCVHTLPTKNLPQTQVHLSKFHHLSLSIDTGTGAYPVRFCCINKNVNFAHHRAKALRYVICPLIRYR